MLTYKTILNIREYPEITLLGLARRGGEPYKQPSELELDEMILAINNREPKIFFPWFLSHSTVANINSSSIDAEALNFLIKETTHRVLNRQPHWVEKINLFHLYGLCRVINTATIVNDNIPVNMPIAQISANTSNLILNKAPINESYINLKILSSPQAARFYAEYQIYYYNGIENLIAKLSDYKNSYKSIIIPQTIASIYATYKIPHAVHDLIEDKILSGMNLPRKIQGEIFKDLILTE